jgi:hypothetical protein
MTSTSRPVRSALLIQHAVCTKPLIKVLVYLVALFISPTILAEGFASIQVDSADVRVGPGAKSELVGTVKRSTILATRGSESGWTRVVLPSGEYRYVMSVSIKPIGVLPPFTPPAQMSMVCTELLKAERKSADEAARIEPNIIKQIELQRVRSDRYKLAIYGQYGIHVAHHTAASVWCVTRQQRAR